MAYVIATATAIAMACMPFPKPTQSHPMQYSNVYMHIACTLTFTYESSTFFSTNNECTTDTTNVLPKP